MRKCKFGYCTVNCKSPKQCADFKAIGCGLAITEDEYNKRKSGGNIIYGYFKSNK